MKNRVIRWLQSGADASEGAQLLKEACAPSFAIKMVASHPEANVKFMKNWLCRKYGVDAGAIAPAAKVTMVTLEEPKTIGFREEFPFLDSPDCPQELEALASRKFARYHRYVELHRALRDCTSLADCASVSRELLNNYMENRLIWDELNYYKEHHSCLGKHPIFSAFRRRSAVMSMSIKDLMKRKAQVENNIWRVNNELKKGNKPHLEVERKSRLFTYEQELADINRLLGE